MVCGPHSSKPRAWKFLEQQAGSRPKNLNFWQMQFWDLEAQAPFAYTQRCAEAGICTEDEPADLEMNRRRVPQFCGGEQREYAKRAQEIDVGGQTDASVDSGFVDPSPDNFRFQVDSRRTHES